MSTKTDLSDLQARLGHRFENPDLLEQALTHASIASRARPDNQRLEFLGDRVLGLVMAQALLDDDPSATEGQIAPRFNALVRKEACAEIAQELQLGESLILGRSESRSGGRRKMALLGDAMEAVIAAVYVDAGFEAAQKLVLRLWGKRISQAEERARDAKTALQEWAQARGLNPPTYVEAGREGPDHAPVFTIEARMQNGMTARAKAASKRAAQQEAAAAILNQIEGENA